MEATKRRLLELLKEKSYRYSPDPPFKLASGRESPYYVDCRPVTHSAEGLALMGEIIFDQSFGIPMFHLKPMSLHSVNFYTKRVFDIVCSISIIALLAIPLSIISLAIMIENPGSIF